MPIGRRWPEWSPFP